MNDPIAELRNIIRQLDPAGEDGFEGLIAAVLTELTGATFTLAKSGSQRGRDGQTALDSPGILFEAKRYDDDIPKNEVLSKIAEVAANPHDNVDLWILGATCPVRTQDVETISQLGEKIGIGTLILDWQATGLPLLATALAMAQDQSATFLAARTATSRTDLLARLQDVKNHGQYANRRQELNEALEQPSIGPAYALKYNVDFLKRALSNERQARTVFGQPLAPGDPLSDTLERKSLRERVSSSAFGPPCGRITAILGGDGNGKSWLFGQSWLEENSPPLTVILTPDDVRGSVTPTEVEEQLISALAAQTDERRGDSIRNRWRKHFERWKKGKLPKRPRLVVFLDGLNQREDLPWVRTLNAFSNVLTSLGGNLCLSCRTPYYRANIKDRLLDELEVVEVGEWTDPELQQLLEARGSAIAKLNSKVVESLRNPRIFSVAAELFKNRKIEGFSELSVSRLLFEHMRAGAMREAVGLTATEFVQGVRHHADEIISRLQKNATIDLKVFERPLRTSLSKQLEIISEGRFFEEVSGNATLYSLKEEGLPTALGLSLLSAAQRAERNVLSISGELSKVLDPISALDNTADILLAALIVGVVGGDASPDVLSALATGFVSLQNVDLGKFAEFKALVRLAPSPFLQSLETSALGEGNISNLSWLSTAMHELRQSPDCWAIMATFINRWMSMYSLAAERRMFGHFDDQEKRELEYRKRKSELDEKVLSLSDVEKSLLATLVLEERGDYTKLNLIAFRLLAGMQLSQFAPSFRNWCFATALNGGFHNAHEEFEDLVQLNQIDWLQTRSAILDAANVLKSVGVSNTGQWALVSLLRSTGDVNDAKEALRIYEDLTKDRERFPGWRLVETWCASDPCDPETLKPANIEATAEKYEAIDVAQLRLFRGQSKEDIFFEGARPGLARFHPSPAVEVMRRFGLELVDRGNQDFRIGAFFLPGHTAALEASSVSKFVDKANSLANQAVTEGDPNNELWVASQYALMVAFPHTEGNEQLAALLAYPNRNNLLLSLCDLFRAPAPGKLEEELEGACRQRDPIRQFRVLAFAWDAAVTLTDRTRQLAAGLVNSTDDLVRLAALGVAYRTNAEELLRAIVQSGWKASRLDAGSHQHEVGIGSEVVVMAFQHNLLSFEECLERISFSAYGSLVRSLDEQSVRAIAARISVALYKAASYNTSAVLPDIEQTLDRGRRSLFYNVEDPGDSNEPLQGVQRASESADVWYARHKRLQDAVENFKRELTTAGAELVLQSLTSDCVSSIARAAPDEVRKWFDFAIGLDQRALSRIHNVAVAIAQAIAVDNQKDAAALFSKLSSSSPFVRITVGMSHVSQDAISLWASAIGDELRLMCFKRLDQAPNDHELGSEVLAALFAGRIDLIREYVLDRRSRPEPVFVARALMVSGLCKDEGWALEAIESQKGAEGFLGGAYEAAKYAMDRFRWSRHWGVMARAAKTPEDFWRFAVLLEKVVDGRFGLFSMSGDASDVYFQSFGPTIRDAIERRIGRWKSKRERTLFGQTAPNVIYLR